MQFQYNLKRDKNNLFLSYSGYKFSTEASIKFLKEIKNYKTFKFLIKNYDEDLINYYFIKLFYESFKVIGHQYIIYKNDKKNLHNENNNYFSLRTNCHSEYPIFSNLKLLKFLYPLIYSKLSIKSIIYSKFNNILISFKNKLRFIKVLIYQKNKKINLNNDCKIGILFGEGVDLNVRSDLYWVPNFNYNKENIIIYFTNPNAFSSDEKKKIQDIIDKIGIISINTWEYNFFKNKKLIKDFDKFLDSNIFDKKENWLNNEAKNLIKKIQFWYNFYENFKIKINQDPYESGLDPLIRQIAIKKFDGCGINRLRTYWGYGVYENTGMYPSDIFFCWGKDSANKISHSYNPKKNLIITGFPYNDVVDKDYLKKINDKLKTNGVKFTILLLDTNISDNKDLIQLMPKNLLNKFYDSFFNLLLDDPEIGIIIKSKKEIFFNQLPVVKKKLDKILNTKRCYITPKPFQVMPNTFSSISDMVVSTGTFFSSALMECVTKNNRCIYYDFPNLESVENKLYNWGKNKVIFTSVDKILINIKLFKENQRKYNDIGNWESFNYMIDPYSDNNGSLRVSEYIGSLYSSFNKGCSADFAIENSSKIFTKNFGEDKIIIDK